MRLRRRSVQEVEADELTEKELDVITTVFRSYETGLREATILPKVVSFILTLENYWKFIN